MRWGVALGLVVAVAAVSPGQAASAPPRPPQGGWIAGDTHVHDDHSSDGSALRQGLAQSMPGNNSVADQIGQAERVGLGFLPLTDHRTYDQMWDPLWRSDKVVLVPGEEANGSPHAIVLGAADEIVDGANPPGSAPYRHFQQSIWEVHGQNGAWSTAHPDDGEWSDFTPTTNASALGVDTVEVWNRDGDPDAEIDYAENRWNQGFRFGVVGASDNHFKELWAVAGPGQPTTWVFAPRPTERGIVAGLRAGRTSVSGGPLSPVATLTADMDGDGVFEAIGGDEVTAVAGHTAKLKIRVRRGVGTTVHLYGSPGRRTKPITTLRPAIADATFVVPIRSLHSWYRVEVRGPGAPAALRPASVRPTSELQAVTSPLFVDHGARATAKPEVPMPPVAAASDAAVTAIETPGDFTGFGDVAQSGVLTHVVAETHAKGGSRVVYQRLRSGAPDGPRVALSRPSSASRFAAVAASGDDVWVVWQDEHGDQTPHTTDIVARHSLDGGRTWDTERRVTNNGRAQRPAVAITAERRAVVAWQDNTSGPFDVWARVLGVERNATNLSAPGKVVTPGNGLDSRSAIYPASLFPSIAVAPDGRISVGWQDNRLDVDPLWTGGPNAEGTSPDDWEVFTATRTRNGKWGFPVNASRSPARADRHPSLAYSAKGELFAAWDTKELKEAGVNVSVRFARSANGATWTAASPVGLDPHAMSQRPQLTLSGDGARAVWFDSRSADWRWSVWTALLGAGGTSAPSRVSGAGNAIAPAIDGPAVVFTSDRHATRPQRDFTQGVFLLSIL